MPLHLLVPLVVGGIFAIMIATVVMGMNKPRRFESEADARYAWEREFPQIEVKALALSRAGNAALVDTMIGPGLVFAIGADSTARLLSGTRTTRTENGLTLHLPDYTAPTVHLALDPEEASVWATRIEAAP
ncbi:hypothetical protein [Tropicibacter sp. S64]|uniref:hypothetical protein n=1 Tax=Tropicibacter sp. S64 TaxID=3415122 RepID=UPI003C7C5A7C